MFIERPSTMPSGTPASEEIWRAVEAFYRREILLLQGRRYREWLKLMHPSIRYRVPVTTSTAGGLVVQDRAIGYYDEDLELLYARVEKLESKQSWVEQPPSRLRYFIQVLEVATTQDGNVSALSNILLLQSRWNLDQQFSGERHDALILEQGSFRIGARTVVMDRQTFTHQGLSVFF
jgi:3-phenylpropionate/cinnamic acid dioxygenase small subunit